MGKRLKSWALGFVVACLCFSMTVFSKENRSIKISLDYENVTMQLFQVAELTDTNEPVLKEKFTAYSVDLFTQGTEKLLETYTERDNIQPDRVEVSDANGEVLFSDLEKGIYLICGADVQEEGLLLCFAPMLVSVPLESSDGTMQSQVEVVAKSENVERTGNCNVLKVWRNNNEKHESVEVQLLRDGVVAEVVSLNDANSWRYSWSGLSVDHEWKVVEKEVPEGYVLQVEKEGDTYILINTFSEEVPEDKPEQDPDGDSSNGDEKLPQTGQLWWPVPVLTILGIIFLVLGRVVTMESER